MEQKFNLSPASPNLQNARKERNVAIFLVTATGCGKCGEARSNLKLNLQVASSYRELAVFLDIAPAKLKLSPYQLELVKSGSRFTIVDKIFNNDYCTILLELVQLFF